MGDLSKNFSRHEFTCKCGCGFDTLDPQLVRILQELRDYYGSPLIVSSACRCAFHNKAEGGAIKSQHLYGRAADFILEGVPTNIVQEFLLQKYPTEYGIGRYDNFTHLDTRNNPARWDKRKTIKQRSAA